MEYLRGQQMQRLRTKCRLEIHCKCAHQFRRQRMHSTPLIWTTFLQSRREKYRAHPTLHIHHLLPILSQVFSEYECFFELVRSTSIYLHQQSLWLKCLKWNWEKILYKQNQRLKIIIPYLRYCNRLFDFLAFSLKTNVFDVVCGWTNCFVYRVFELYGRKSFNWIWVLVQCLHLYLRPCPWDQLFWAVKTVN